MKPAAAAALLWPTLLATAARVDLTAMEKVAVATYRKTGSDKALLHEKWERIEFEKTRSALIKLPDAVIDAVCGGKPCWRLSTQGFGPFSTTAFRFRAEGKDAPDLYEAQVRLTLTMGVDIFPFCATGEHFEVIPAPPNPKCRFSTALDTKDLAMACGCSWQAYPRGCLGGVRRTSSFSCVSA